MDKNSFVLYTDYMEPLEELSMEERGQVMTALFKYAAGEEVPEMDVAARVAFAFIRSQINRDTIKWQETKDKRTEAGSKGGQARASKAKQSVASDSKSKQTVANVSKGKQTVANDSINVNVNVNDNVNVINNNTARDGLQEYLDAYPKKTSNVIAVDSAFCSEVAHGVDPGEIVSAARNYSESVKILCTDDRFIKNPDRFIRDRTYLDYIPGNYKKPRAAPKPQQRENAFNQFKQNTYDFDALEKRAANNECFD